MIVFGIFGWMGICTRVGLSWVTPGVLGTIQIPRRTFVFTNVFVLVFVLVFLDGYARELGSPGSRRCPWHKTDSYEDTMGRAMGHPPLTSSHLVGFPNIYFW